MQTEGTSRGRLGMLALAISGVLYGVTLLFRGPVILDPAANPTGFAQAVTSDSYVSWALGTIIANVLHLLGILALYGLLAHSAVGRWAFWALIFIVIHDVLFPSFLGFSLALPAIGDLYLQGQESVIEAATISLPVLSALALGGVLGTVGSILFGVGIWRTRTLLRWTAIPFALALPLLAWAPMFSFPLEFFGAVLLAAAGAGLTIGVWSSQAKSTRAVETTP